MKIYADSPYRRNFSQNCNLFISIVQISVIIYVWNNLAKLYIDGYSTITNKYDLGTAKTPENMVIHTIWVVLVLHGIFVFVLCILFLPGLILFMSYLIYHTNSI